MAVVVAVDFGEKRIGLATSDATGVLATPRTTLSRRSDAAAVRDLEAFCREVEAAVVVFGIPRSPEGRESAFAGRIRSFAGRFERQTGLPVRFHEETLTSNEAARRLPPGASRDEVDRTAAAILLEDYLQHAGTPGR